MRVLKLEEIAFVAGGEGEGDGGCGPDGGCGESSDSGMCGPDGVDTGITCTSSTISATSAVTGQSVSLNVNSIFSGHDNFGFSISVNGLVGTLSASVNALGNVEVSVTDSNGHVIGGFTMGNGDDDSIGRGP